MVAPAETAKAFQKTHESDQRQRIELFYFGIQFRPTLIHHPLPLFALLSKLIARGDELPGFPQLLGASFAVFPDIRQVMLENHPYELEERHGGMSKSSICRWG